MRPVCVIANPHAGGGLTAKTLPVVEAALRRRGIAFRVERTHSIEHARELARETVAAGEVAAAMGGDGLLGAVAGELRGTNGVLAVIPGGRGNDFARKLGIGSDPLAACDIIAGGVVGQIDVADINGSAFLGIASAGLDSDAGDIANETRLRLGRLVYLYATLRALRAWKSAHWEVVIDAEPHSFSGYSVAVANSGVFGGGMFLAPRRSSTTACSTSCSSTTPPSASTSTRCPRCSPASTSPRRRSSSCAGARSRSTPTGRSPSTPTATRSPSCRPRFASSPAHCGS